jgi:hypothetical protein
VEQALADAKAYFEHRDRMNAMVHTPDIVRWSPITIKMRDALSTVHARMRGG